MPRLGDESYDVPCITGPGIGDPDAMKADAHTARNWIEKYIDLHDVPARTRIVSNSHDFGSYPSIEIDYSFTPCQVAEYGGDCDPSCESCGTVTKALDKIRAMEIAYGVRFKDTL